MFLWQILDQDSTLDRLNNFHLSRLQPPESVTNLQVEDKLWDDILLDESNGTATPSSSCESCSEGTIVSANLYKLFQFGTAIYNNTVSESKRNKSMTQINNEARVVLVPALVQDTAAVVAVVHEVSKLLQLVFLTARTNQAINNFAILMFQDFLQDNSP